MKRISLIGVSMLALCGMWSCGKKVPEEIIQPQAMENLSRMCVPLPLPKHSDICVHAPSNKDSCPK